MRCIALASRVCPDVPGTYSQHQRSVNSRRLRFISSKPVSGLRDQMLKGSGITSALPTTRPERGRAPCAALGPAAPALYTAHAGKPGPLKLQQRHFGPR
jgi:hypothetical protein